MKKIFYISLVFFFLLITGCNKHKEDNKYKVEFIVENNIIETIYVEKGKNIKQPKDPVLNGYIFEGWYIDGEKWLFSSNEVICDIKLTAKFSKVDINEKFVPIYQGMKAESISTNLGDIQNNIKDEVFPSIDVIETKGVEFFTTKGEKYLVTIHLYNPSSYEILSFTLDGKKYQSYEFKEGSNSTKLIIELNAPNVSGIKELTIDAIKYVDGTEILDVIMEGEKTIHIGVKHEITPTATLINDEIKANSYTADVEIVDYEKLLNVNTDLLVFLYDGNTIVEKKNLKLGTNVIEFNNLKTNKCYEYIIVGVYDRLDGQGKCAYILFEDSFKTTCLMELINITSSKKDISFEILNNNPNSILEAIELYYNNNLINTTNTSGIFTNLLSNTEYKLVLKYNYPFENGIESTSLEYFIKTKELETPIISLDSFNSSKSEINYQINMFDKDKVIESLDVKLYSNNNLISFKKELNGTFENLLSNNTYHLVLYYEYDLNDGRGRINEKFTYDIKTLENDEPIVDLLVYANEKNIEVKTTIIDKDNVVLNKKIKCYNNEMLIEETSELNYDFKNLLSNTTYRIVVEVEYDLNDGTGVKTISKMINSITSKIKPSVEVVPITITNSSIYFDLKILNNDSVCEVSSISLYKDKTLVQRLIDLQTRDFQALESYTNYEIKVAYQYDLHDGNGIVVNTYSYSFNTAKFSPNINFIDNIPTFDEYCVELIIEDTQNSGTLSSIKLIYNNVVQKELTSFTGSNINYLFKGLYSNSVYTIEALYTYDLCDLEGVRQTTFKQTVTTPKRETPKVELDDILVKYQSISFDYIIENPDDANLYIKELSVIKDKKYKYDCNSKIIEQLNSASSYQLNIIWCYNLNDNTGNHEINIKYDFTTLTYADPYIKLDNINTTYNTIEFNTVLEYQANILFNVKSAKILLDGDLVANLTDLSNIYIQNLYAGRIYTYVIDYEYNLYDGLGLQSKTFEQEIKTNSHKKPEFIFNNLLVDNFNIMFNLSYLDVDSLLSNIISVTLYDGNNVIKSETYKEVYEYNNLLSNHIYTVVIEYMVNLNDGFGNVKKVYEQNFVTKNKNIPVVEFDNINSTVNSIEFNLNITDSDNVIKIINYELYNQGTLINTLNFGDKLLFNNLETGIKYLIRVNYQFDLEDGKGIHTSYIQKEVLTIDELIKVTSIDVLNTGYIRTNDELHLRINIENPHELVITSLIINNKVINVTDVHVINQVFIKFVPETKGGVYKISVNGLEYESQGLTASQKIIEPYSITVNIIGKFEVLEITPLTNDTYYIDKISYLLKIDNGSNYKINRVKLQLLTSSSSDYIITIVPTKIKDDYYQIDINFENLNKSYSYFYGIKILSINYNELNYQLNEEFTPVYPSDDLLYNYSCYSFIFNSNYYSSTSVFNSIINISSVEDLNAVAKKFTKFDVVILNITNDIDFKNQIYTPFTNFNGVILGNNYSFKNISYIGDNFDGLFGTFRGYVENLNFENIYIDSADHATIFAGKIIDSVIKNITIDGYIKGEESASLAISTTYSYLYNIKNNAKIVGDLTAGISYELTDCRAEKCYNYGDINGVETAAGLFYFAICENILEISSSKWISKCGNYGNIKANSAVGLVHLLRYINLNNSFNYGNVEGNQSASSICLNLNNSSIDKCISIADITLKSSLGSGILVLNATLDEQFNFITNSICIGKCISKYAGPNFFEPIIDNFYISGLPTEFKNLNITNYFNLCHRYLEGDMINNIIKGDYGYHMELKKFNEFLFYNEVLGYDPLIWNYENIDIENGIYPTLK